MTNKLTAQEVCKKVNISIFTLNNWYRFKKENPNDELALILPEFEKDYEKSQRTWNTEDIKLLKLFKSKRKLGRNGQMSKTIQKYYKKKKEGE